MREAITLYTGVEIGANLRLGAERLRQFVEGIEDKEFPGVRKFPRPQSQALEAIVTFVTDSELDLLRAEELEEDVTGLQAPVRLLELMRASNTLPVTGNLNKLTGYYLTIHPDKDSYKARSLTI